MWNCFKNYFIFFFSVFFLDTIFKSICFCRQLSGVFDPTSGYIIQLFLADVAAIVLNGLTVDCHLIVVALVVVMMNFAYLDFYQPNSNPMLNRQNWMDLCHRCYQHMVHRALAMALLVVLPIFFRKLESTLLFFFNKIKNENNKSKQNECSELGKMKKRTFK